MQHQQKIRLRGKHLLKIVHGEFVPEADGLPVIPKYYLDLCIVIINIRSNMLRTKKFSDFETII